MREADAVTCLSPRWRQQPSHPPERQVLNVKGLLQPVSWAWLDAEKQRAAASEFRSCVGWVQISLPGLARPESCFGDLYCKGSQACSPERGHL